MLLIIFDYFFIYVVSDFVADTERWLKLKKL